MECTDKQAVAIDCASSQAVVNHGVFLSLLYHDIFAYPLTRKELSRWQVVTDARRTHRVQRTGDYLHLGQGSLAVVRRLRQRISSQKMKHARRAAHLLQLLPTIRGVAVTGSLAMGNAGRGSDIDLMIITTAKALWTTRLLAVVMVWLSGIRLRRVGKRLVENALCLNLWLTSDALAVPVNMRSLYTAHEVLQVVPLVNKGHIFQQFLSANNWVREYWQGREIKKLGYSGTNHQFFHHLAVLLSQFLAIFDLAAYFLQRWHMRKHQTRELIESGRAFFHPVDWDRIVMQQFLERVEAIAFHNATFTAEIPTDTLVENTKPS